MNNDLNLIQCTLCGCNEMIKEDQDTYRCKSCNALYNREDYQKMLDFNNDIVNQLSNNLKTEFEENEKKNIGKARQNLFNELNKQLNKNFLSSKDIIKYAKELKNLVSDDVLANFFSLIDNPYELNEYMTELDYNILQKPQKNLIVKFLLRYIDLLKKDNVSIELNELIETYGRTSEEYKQYYKQYCETMKKINDGYFDVSLHRDVFVAHSGKDKEKVKEIVKILNDNGFKCFVSFLNLFHGSGEQDDYRKELQKAMDNCSIFLFVSSNNSRFRDCEAITIEMQYIKDKDLSELPKEFKNIPYDKLDFKYKKPRVEFILEDYNKTNTIGETKCKEFFAGLERIYNSEELIKRIDKLLTNLRIPTEQIEDTNDITITENNEKNIDKKICLVCNTLNEINSKFCKSCGSKNLISYKEYIENAKIKYCANCGSKILKKDKYCTCCGSKKFIDLEKHKGQVKKLSKKYNDFGNKFYKGEEVKQDYEKAVEWYTKSAEQGNSEAQYSLGNCYKFGQGVKQDYEKAVEWYIESARQGNIEAQCNLGNCYRFGQGVKQDYEKAVEWYIKSASKGNAEAQFGLGYCYSVGKGINQNYEKAVEWYTKSANQGNLNAQCNLGYSYSSGQGVKQDYNKAIKWYTKSAEQGNSDAQFNLGYCYAYGHGVQVDYKKAFELYMKSANQGHTNAQNNVGYCYELGRGVQVDYKKALEWYTKAADKGNTYAQSNLKKLKSKI